MLQRRMGRRRLHALPVRPRHVGVVVDGNRRWSKAAGYTDSSVGHKVGAERVGDLLGWAETAGIEHVTVYLLSADNLRERPPHELAGLHTVLRQVLPRAIERAGSWRIHLSGDPRLLPEEVAHDLRAARERTSSRPRHVTLAVGYDGRQDIVDGVRAALLRAPGSADIAALDADQITAALPGGPVKDIDLVIRSSGEQRLSGFCPWQTQGAEIYLSPKLWPAFARRDFAAALAHFAAARGRQAG